MESLLKKFKALIGTYDEEHFDEEEYEEYEEEYEESVEEYGEYEDESVGRKAPVLKVVPTYRDEEPRANIIKKPSRDSYMHVDYRPHRFEDMEHVVDVLDAGKSVILHLDGIDERLCQRVLDFASGVVCTMKCISAMPNDYVCILIPCVESMFTVAETI